MAYLLPTSKYTHETTLEYCLQACFIDVSLNKPSLHLSVSDIIALNYIDIFMKVEFTAMDDLIGE
jgi:hypothetical protein